MKRKLVVSVVLFIIILALAVVVMGQTPQQPQAAQTGKATVTGAGAPVREAAVPAGIPAFQRGAAGSTATWIQRGQAWWPYATVLPPYNGKLKATEDMNEEDIRVNDVAMVNALNPEAAYTTMPKDLLIPQGAQLNQRDGYYLIKLSGFSRTKEQLDELEAAGAVLGEYLHINTYIAKIPSSAYGAVKGLPFVSAVLDYQPAYKISPQIGLTAIPPEEAVDAATGAAKPWFFELQLHGGADVQEVLDALAQLSIYPEKSDVVTSTFDKNLTTIFVRTAPAGIPALAKIPGVKFILEHAYPHLMASSTQPTAIPMVLQNNGTYTTSSSGWKLWNAGIKGDASGTAQVVTMMDTGLNTNMEHFSQNTATVGTVGASHRKVVGYDNYGGDLCVMAYTGGDYGHGTWTSQCAVGSISNMTSSPDTTHTPNANYDDGIAPNGKVYFQDIGNSAGSLNPPLDLGPSITAAIGKGSYVQNHSWGTSTDSYDTEASNLDAALYSNPNMVVTVSAGNSGTTGTGSIGSPSTAKNCITVGGVDATMPSNLFEDCSWDGTATCASTDLGSSRGPVTTSLRTKPDICTYIYDSGTLGNETGWAADEPLAMCQTDGTKTVYWQWTNGFGLGGTSFSAPEAAGLAAEVRDYFMAGYYPTGSATPANAMTPAGSLVKAIILASGETMATTAWPNTNCTGCAAIGARPSSDVGWGRANLPAALHIGSGAPYLWVKNNQPLANGSYDTYNFTLNSNSTPLRVMLVWYDKSGNNLVDNLDLTVTIGASTYLGNRFSGGWSTTGGTADATNPQEGVFLDSSHGLPASGSFTVKVSATNSPDAVPYSLVVVGDMLGSSIPYANMSQSTYICHGTVSATIIDAGGTPTNAVYHSTSGASYPAAISGGPGTYTTTSVTTDQLGAADGDDIWLTFTGDDSNPYSSAHSKLDCSLNVCAYSVDPLSGGCDGDPYMDDGETLNVNVAMTNSELFDTPTGFTAQLEVDPAYPNANITIVNNTATWDVIPGGGTAYASGVPFQVRYTAQGGGPILCHFKVYNIKALDNSWSGNASCAANSFTEYANTNTTLGTTYASNTFDASLGWTATQVSGTGQWARATTMTNPTMNPYAGAGMAYFASYNFASGTQSRLATPTFSLGSATLPQVSFYMTHDTTWTNDDTIAVQISTDAGTSWTTLNTFHRRDGGTVAGVWINHVVDLSAYIGQTTVQVGFLATSAYGDNMAIDSVVVANYTRVNDPQNCTTAAPILTYDDGNWMFDDSQCNNLSDWTNWIPSPDAGESGSLLIYLGNSGNEEAYNVQGTLTCPSCPSGVQICQNTANYGTIPYGTSYIYAPIDHGFEIALPTGVASGADLPFVMNITTSNAGYTPPVVSTVLSPHDPYNTRVGTPTIQGSCTSPYASITGTTTDVSYDNFQIAPATASMTGRCGPSWSTTGWTVGAGTVALNTATATPTGDTNSARMTCVTGGVNFWRKFDTTGMDYDVQIHSFINLSAATTCALYLEYTPNGGTNWYTLGGPWGGQAATSWGELGPFSVYWAIWSGTGTGFGPAAANAIFNNAQFGLRFRATRSSGSTGTYFYIDDLEVDMYKFVNDATTCSGTCAAPNVPTLNLITDNSACAQDGIHVYYTGSLGAASYNLMKDGVALATGYTSGALANPGDSLSHSYTIRAVNPNGTTDSAARNFTDMAQANTPTITCNPGTCSDPTQVVLTTEQGQTNYQWYNGATPVGTNSYTYTATVSGTYTVKYTAGACASNYSDGKPVIITGGCTPPSAPVINSITDVDACALSGIQVNYTSGTPATRHDLYRDGSLVASSYVSGATYTPGDTSSHSYVVRAVNIDDTCYTDSNSMSGTDANNSVAAPSAPGVADVDPCVLSGVSITWGSVSGATGYDLQVDGGAITADVTSPYTYSPGDSNSHTYAIRAKNATCNSAFSSTTAGTDAICSPPPETAPGGDLSTAQTWSDKNNQTWPAASGTVTGYRLYRGQKTDLANLLNSNTDSCKRYDGAATTANTPDDPTTLSAGDFYWYIVTAYNGAGEGSAGNATAGPRTINSTGDCP